MNISANNNNIMTMVSTTSSHTGVGKVANEVSGHLDVDVVPGTEILTDFHSTALAHTDGKNVVLVPQPQNNVHDPLNWSPRWKYIILVNIALYMFLTNFTTLSISPMTPVLQREFDTSITRIALLTGATNLALGYANFIIIPCANVFGRRPTAIVCSIICIAANVWEALAGSYSSLLGGRILVGIGAAISESFMPMIIADIVFLHERGRWMGIYFWAFFTGAWLGPVVAGTIAGHVSWRWFFWLAAIMQCVNLIALILFFPETKYRRENSVPKMPHATAPSNTQEHGSHSHAGDKEAQADTNQNSSFTRDDIPIDESGRSVFLGKGFPSHNQRWNLWFQIDRIGLKLLPRDILTPFYISILPIVVFASCCLAFPACALLVLNLLESPAFSAAPFYFSPASVGYTNFALMGGGIFGLLTAGPFSDWSSMVLTRRNKGIREPEMRLFSLIPFIIIGLIGMTVTALGFQHSWPWPVVVVIGFGFSGCMVMAIPAIGITYAVDSYKPIAGEIMVVATVWKNTFAYGMVYYVNPWAERSGYVPPIMTIAALSVGIPTLGIPIFWYFGKSCRRLTRNSKLHSY